MTVLYRTQEEYRIIDDFPWEEIPKEKNLDNEIGISSASILHVGSHSRPKFHVKEWSLFYVIRVLLFLSMSETDVDADGKEENL